MTAAGTPQGVLAHLDVAAFGTWAPIIIAIGIMLWICWMDFGVRTPDDQPPETPTPPTVPTIEQGVRDDDRG